jgi:hypothetical protein
VASQSESLAQLRQIGSITGSYGADYQDRMWGFSWTPTQVGPTQYQDLRTHAALGVLEAASAQATDILRRRGHEGIQLPSSWVPHVAYSYLVLTDYLNSRLPWSLAVAPGDRYRASWAAQPEENTPQDWRFRYWSSYELPPAFYSPDARTATTGAVIQGGGYNMYQIVLGSNGSHPMAGGQRRLTQVQFPAAKALMYSVAQWDGAATPVYFMYDHARVPVVTVDGSAAVRVQGTANLGFRPNEPTSPFGSTATYSNPQAWDPPVIGGVTTLNCRIRFTRWGLRGRDFDGEEVQGP